MRLNKKINREIEEPAARVFHVPFVFSNARSVLLQSNTGLRPFHLLYDIEVMWGKTIKQAFSLFYTLVKPRAGSYLYLTVILRGRAGYELIYNQRGRRPSWLLSAHIRQVREE